MGHSPRSPTTLIRDVRLHAGLNIVWAQELPAAEGATEVDRAGHGVGKSTFSLMLRAVLGDDGAAVRTMRGHLAEHYGSGGIAAELSAGAGRFAVFRSFGSQSFALKRGTVESLLDENARADALDFSSYVTALGEQACLQHMPRRALPVTGQAVEWGHVLCWIARDQALGLRQYFEWRNDDGTGLRRKVKDPPALVRLALGLVTDAETTAEQKIASIHGELSAARDTLKVEEQRGTNTRGIVETQLRTWAGASNSLQMVADDLFANSVEKELQRKTRQLEAKNEEDRSTVAALERELIDLTAEIQARTPIVQLAKDRWHETVALRNNDQTSLKEIRERRDKLLTLSGSCQYGGIAYSDCRHVQEQRDTVKLATQRDVAVLSKVVGRGTSARHERRPSTRARRRDSPSLAAVQAEKAKRKTVLNNAIEARLRQLGQGDAVRGTLSHNGTRATRLLRRRIARRAHRGREPREGARRRQRRKGLGAAASV